MQAQRHLHLMKKAILPLLVTEIVKIQLLSIFDLCFCNAKLTILLFIAILEKSNFQHCKFISEA
jgi:hypothetical protein